MIAVGATTNNSLMAFSAVREEPEGAQNVCIIPIATSVKHGKRNGRSPKTPSPKTLNVVGKHSQLPIHGPKTPPIPQQVRPSRNRIAAESTGE